MIPAYRMILLAGMIVISSAIKAQTNLDSLWSVWQDESRPDTSRLNALHWYIWEGYVYSQPDSAYYLSRVYYEYAKEKNLSKQMAAAVYFQGVIFYVKGKYDQAIEYYNRSLTMYEGAGDKKGLVQSLNGIGNVHRDQGEYDEAIRHFNRTLEISEEIEDRLGVAASLNSAGQVYKEQGDFVKAIDCFERSLKIFKEIKHARGMAITLNNIGTILQDQSNFAEAIDFFTRSLKISEEIRNKNLVSNALNNIGLIYKILGDYERALDYYERCLKMDEDLDNKMGVATSLNNIGGIYQERGDAAGMSGNSILVSDNYSKAIDCFVRSLRIREEIEDKSGIAQSLNNIGHIYQAQGRSALASGNPRISREKFALALDHFSRSLSFREQMGDKVGMARTLNSIGRYYLYRDQLREALSYSSRSMSIAEQVGALHERRDAAESLWEVSKKLGHYKEALEMHELYIAMRDSITSEENQREVIRQEYKYNYEKEALADSLQHAAELAQVENERTIESLRADRNRNRGLAAGGGAFLLLAGGGAWFITDRKRRKERFEKEAATLETQALRSQMNPHFIFNALNSINAFVQQNDPDNATSFLTKFARVMRSVLENSRHSEVPLQDDLETLRSYMDLERKRMHEQFDFSIEVDPAIDPEEVMVPPLVVQPFVENAIWHGMKGRTDKGHITLRVKQAGEQLLWQIEDDGAGRQPKQEPAPEATPDQPVKKTSLGTAITRSRLDLVQKQHGGKAGFHYEDLPKGTRVTVEMPLLRA